MKVFKFSLSAFFLIVLSTTLFSQKMLFFDLNNSVKRVRYYEGYFIKVKTINKQHFQGYIEQITDSTFRVEGKVIALGQVSKVYNTQKFAGFELLSNIFIFPAIGYFPLNTVNRLINKDNPVISENTITYSAIFIGAYFITSKIANRSYKISEKRPLRVVDLTI